MEDKYWELQWLIDAMHQDIVNLVRLIDDSVQLSGDV